MERLTRGRFVAAAAAGVAGIAVPNARAVQPGTTVYCLDPCAGPSEGGRCSCRACEAHAANKVFFTGDSADAGRAHTHCNCGIVPKQVAPGIRQALHRQSADGVSVDRRQLPGGLASQV